MATGVTAPVRRPPEVAQVRVPERSVRSDLRAVKIVWQRELIRFYRDRMRLVVALVQPILFLFVLGTGLSSLAGDLSKEVSLRTFMFPGVLALAVMFTALFSAASIVWDREFGFLREMLVAPVRRGAIVIGKALGGATVATAQGLVMLSLAGVVGVPYDPLLIIELAGIMALLAFTITAVGVMAAARVQSIQSFMGLAQLLLMPMFFLSGALFPLSSLPAWLEVLTRVNPLTYAVEPMRHVVFQHLDISAATKARLDPGVTWGTFHVPVGLDIAIVALLGLTMLALAIVQFRRAD